MALEYWYWVLGIGYWLRGVDPARWRDRQQLRAVLDLVGADIADRDARAEPLNAKRAAPSGVRPGR